MNISSITRQFCQNSCHEGQSAGTLSLGEQLLINLSIRWLTGQMTDWVSDWVVDWLIDWLRYCLTEVLIDCITESDYNCNQTFIKCHLAAFWAICWTSCATTSTLPPSVRSSKKATLSSDFSSDRIGCSAMQNSSGPIGSPCWVLSSDRITIDPCLHIGLQEYEACSKLQSSGISLATASKRVPAKSVEGIGEI